MLSATQASFGVREKADFGKGVAEALAVGAGDVAVLSVTTTGTGGNSGSKGGGTGDSVNGGDNQRRLVRCV